jgi:hypothetical protein
VRNSSFRINSSNILIFWTVYFALCKRLPHSVLKNRIRTKIRAMLYSKVVGTPAFFAICFSSQQNLKPDFALLINSTGTARAKMSIADPKLTLLPKHRAGWTHAQFIAHSLRLRRDVTPRKVFRNQKSWWTNRAEIRVKKALQLFFEGENVVLDHWISHHLLRRSLNCRVLVSYTHTHVRTHCLLDSVTHLVFCTPL